MLMAAMSWTGTGERIVLASAVVVALGVLWRYIARPVWRFIRWLQHEVRDEMDRRKRTDALLERELTHNGGSSMKDQATKAATMATEAAAMATQAANRAENLDGQVAEIRSAQATTFAVLDEIIERRAEDAAAIDEVKLALGELADLKSVIVALAADDDADPLDELRRDRRATDPKEPT